MIRQYKGNFYTENEVCYPKFGDLVDVDGKVGVLKSEWDPHIALIELENGRTLQLTGGDHIKVLRPVRLNTAIK